MNTIEQIALLEESLRLPGCGPTPATYREAGRLLLAELEQRAPTMFFPEIASPDGVTMHTIVSPMQVPRNGNKVDFTWPTFRGSLWDYAFDCVVRKHLPKYPSAKRR